MAVLWKLKECPFGLRSASAELAHASMSKNNRRLCTYSGRILRAALNFGRSDADRNLGYGGTL